MCSGKGLYGDGGAHQDDSQLTDQIQADQQHPVAVKNLPWNLAIGPSSFSFSEESLPHYE
jgi:hypothetical protein